MQEGTWSADVEGGRGPCNDHGLPGHVFALPDGRYRTFEYVPKCRVPGCEHWQLIIRVNPPETAPPHAQTLVAIKAGTWSVGRQAGFTLSFSVPKSSCKYSSRFKEILYIYFPSSAKLLLVVKSVFRGNSRGEVRVEKSASACYCELHVPVSKMKLSCKGSRAFSFYATAAQIISTHFTVELKLAMFLGSLIFGVDKLSSKPQNYWELDQSSGSP